MPFYISSLRYLGGRGTLESKMAWTLEEGHVSRRRAMPARISACSWPTTLGSHFRHFSMLQLSALLQIPSGSDRPHESLFEIGLNSNTRRSPSATKDSHYLETTQAHCASIIVGIFGANEDCPRIITRFFALFEALKPITVSFLLF